MAAPQSSPDLGVVPSENESAPNASSPSPAPATSRPADRPKRRGVPIWVVLAVAALGLYGFVVQYQRAEGLDAQVVSLTGELEEVGQQLDAYRSHLTVVRTSVGDLNDRMGVLNSLVNRDPLAPADSAAPAGASQIDLAPSAVADDSNEAGSTAVVSAASASSQPASGALRDETVDRALAAPFSESLSSDVLQGDEGVYGDPPAFNSRGDHEGALF